MAQRNELPLTKYHQAGREITNGNPKVYKQLYSRRDDVTLANPFGPPALGWRNISATLERAAQNYRDGEGSLSSTTCPRSPPPTWPTRSRSRATGLGSAERRR
jgi:hypothetical protein